MSLVLSGLVLLSCGCEQTNGQTKFRAVTAADLEEPLKPAARLFWQDLETATLYWADFQFSANRAELQAHPVAGFPQLEQPDQKLVQMDVVDGVLVVGVRDQRDGCPGSGWVAVSTGVDEVPHGDHSDWKFSTAPAVLRSLLDAEQGNPAHLYVYDNQFFMANDNLNGFTRLGVRRSKKKTPEITTRFFAGGGHHITLAAVDNKIAYSTWIDRDGEDAGRVDVVDLQAKPGQESLHQFHLPTGVIHGATANSGRVFFAPADGICWIAAARDRNSAKQTPTIGHLSLGTDPETNKPLRTGAFTNHRDWVLCTTGQGASAALCLIPARAAEPQVVTLPLETPDTAALVTPQTVLAASGKRYAFVFQDLKGGATGDEFLSIVDLDPNGDRNFADAAVVKRLTVGASRVDGHSGHHDLACDATGKFAFVTNPGSGSIWVLRLSDLEIVHQFSVPGTPGGLIVVGAPSAH